MRPVILSFAAAAIVSGAAFAADTGQSTDVTATMPQAVMQNTSPVPDGSKPGTLPDTSVPRQGTANAPVVTSTPGATEAQFAGDPNEVICRDGTSVTGTIFKAKVCHTRREWAEAQDASHKWMNSFHHYGCGGDGGCTGK